MRCNQSGLAKSDACYLAGIIDGEGCIRMNNSPRLQVTSTDPRLMNWLHTRLRGYVWSEDRKPPCKPIYVWELSARAALAVIRDVRPFLVMKRDQADIVIRYYSEGFVPRPRNARQMAANVAKRESAKAQLKVLNRKGA